MALSEKVAATTQFRQPSWSMSGASDTRQESLPVWGSYLFARLWTDPPSSQSGAVFGDDGSPAACLAVDLVKASAGVPVQSRGNVLVVGFQSIQSAISAARQLQWAMQGISESPLMQGNSVALLIQSAPEVQGNEVPQILDQVAPGQILLSDKACQLFENIPGLPLQATSDTRLRELLWRVQDDQATPASDEQFYAELLAMHGLEYHPPQEFAPVITPAEVSSFGEEGLEAPGGVAAIVQLLRANPRWLIGGGVAAAVLLGLLIIPHLFSGKSESTVNPTSTAPESTGGTPNVTPPAGSSAPAPASQGKTSPAQQTQDKNKKTPAVANNQPAQQQPPSKSKANVPNVSWVKDNESVPAKIQVAPPAPKQEQPAQRGSKCDMDQSEILLTLNQAERARGRGKYSDALRQFSDVLACEPNNARAKEGLELVKRAKDAQN